MIDKLSTSPLGSLLNRGVGGVSGIEKPLTPSGGVEKAKGPSFADFLSDKLDEAHKYGFEAEAAIERAITGEEANPHVTAIALQKADISMSLLVSVKDRLERAYQELIRLPV